MLCTKMGAVRWAKCIACDGWDRSADECGRVRWLGRCQTYEYVRTHWCLLSAELQHKCH